MNMHFRTFRLQPPHAPPSSGHTSCSGRAWPPIRLFRLSAVLRTSFIPSRLISRIRPYRVCVAALVRLQFYGLSLHFQLLSTSCRHDAVTFSYPAGSSASEGLSPSVHAHSQAHWGRTAIRREAGRLSHFGTNGRSAGRWWSSRWRRVRSESWYRQRRVGRAGVWH